MLHSRGVVSNSSYRIPRYAREIQIYSPSHTHDSTGTLAAKTDFPLLYNKQPFVTTRTQASLRDISEQCEDSMNAQVSLNVVRRYFDPEENEYAYSEIDNNVEIRDSLNLLFWGSAQSFLRLSKKSILAILRYTKQDRVPPHVALMAWDRMKDGKSPKYLSSSVIATFGFLLVYVPEEDLYEIDLKNRHILKYFAVNITLPKRKTEIIVDAYKKQFKHPWLNSYKSLISLGKLLCGFPTNELKHIQPSDLKQVPSSFFALLKSCTPTQIKVIYEIATHPDAFGLPETWKSQDIANLGYMFVHIPSHSISALALESMSGLKKVIIKEIPDYKILKFSYQQVSKLDDDTKREYILRLKLITTYKERVAVSDPNRISADSFMQP